MRRVQALRLAPAAWTPSPVITVSVGVCANSGHEPGSPEALLRTADAQLNKAKEAGRNQSGGLARPAPGPSAALPG